MKKIRVAINGFGRIGRAFFKVALEKEDIDIVAVNDLGDKENLAYLLQYDSAYGVSDFDVETNDDTLRVNGEEFKFLNEKDPSKLPWAEMEIDIVVESTGVFTRYDKAKAHIDAGAKRVVISAPSKDDENEGDLGKTILMGVNDDQLKTCQISSNGSCTTNAGSPLMKILQEKLGVEKAMLNTIHGYTASQNLVDSPNKDWRRGRAAAQNIVPTSTGAAIAVTKALTDLKDKFDGIAIRVPVIVGSIADITFISKKETSSEEVNKILREAAKDERWKNIFSVTDKELVSTDIIGSKYASIADLSMTKVVGGNLVKVLSWYDNEIGYTYSLINHVIKAGNTLS